MSWSKIWSALADMEMDRPTYMWAFYERLLNGFDFKGKKVLELGCGTGFNSLIMAQRGARLTLLDSSPEALEIAKSNFRKCGLKGTFILGDALKNNLNGFDLVHSEGLIEHFTGPGRQAIVDAHAKAAKKGGKILIIVPNRACLSYRFGKWLGEKTGTWPWGYENPYSKTELNFRVKKAGLTPELFKNGEFATSFFWAFLPLWSKSSVLGEVLSAPASPTGITLNYDLTDKHGRVVAVVARKK